MPVDPDLWKPALASQIRGLWTCSKENGRNLHEIAAELRAAADLFEASGSTALPHALKNMPRANPVDRTPGVLREIAAHVGEWNSSPQGAYADNPPAPYSPGAWLVVLAEQLRAA